jgi:hypothetical protein
MAQAIGFENYELVARMSGRVLLIAGVACAVRHTERVVRIRGEAAACESVGGKVAGPETHALLGGEGVGDFGEDGGGFDFDFAFHAEDFEEDFDAFLGREDLGDEGADAAEGSFEQLHFVADRDGGGDFDGFLVDDRSAEFGDDVFGDDGRDAAEADDRGDAVRRGDMAVGLAEIEFGEDIAGEHGFGDFDSAAAAGALEAEHGAKDLDADIAQEHAAGGGFATGLGFHTEPAEFLVLEMSHGFIFSMGGRVASAGKFPGARMTRQRR